MYQKCPVCNGIGKVEKLDPPYFVICGTCNGSGIINKITGMPPETNIERSINDDIQKVIKSDINE